MPEFQKLPVTIEAQLFDGALDGREELEAWIHDNGGRTRNWFFDGSAYASFNILTLEGPMEASKGDWIIKGIKGEFYPCKPDVFHESYIEVAECTCETPTFEQELVSLINKHSMENFSGTPDWILANYLYGVLRQFDCAVAARANWRGETTELPALAKLELVELPVEGDPPQ